MNTGEFDLLHVMNEVEQHHSQKSLADSVGYSVGKVNYILKALAEKGFIKIENFLKSDNKKGYRYLLTQEGLKQKISLTEAYIEIKQREYEELQESLATDKAKLNYE